MGDTPQQHDRGARDDCLEGCPLYDDIEAGPREAIPSGDRCDVCGGEIRGGFCWTETSHRQDADGHVVGEPRIYVATAFGNRDAARLAQEEAARAGFGVSWDWTPCDDSGFELEEDRRRYRRECAVRDAAGVRDADAVLVLAHPDMRSTIAEAGMAIALGKPLAVVRRADGPRVIFWDHPGVMHFNTVEGAVAALRSAVRRPPDVLIPPGLL